jgi:hypothetical protein
MGNSDAGASVPAPPRSRGPDAKGSEMRRRLHRDPISLVLTRPSYDHSDRRNNLAFSV